ncbi:hypothetical protein R1flu_010964 [Riccia fluitans]|uniref:Uncharacterized protein n=1 Tax=Riccia fluitans TaxID=41844 RepID=A0ABD1Z6H8_9MARC
MASIKSRAVSVPWQGCGKGLKSLEWRSKLQQKAMGEMWPRMEKESRLQRRGKLEQKAMKEVWQRMEKESRLQGRGKLE